jgi:hypothetical protein
LWVWSEAVTYYLDAHGVAPDPELGRRIAGQGYRCPAVTAQTVERAVAALAERARVIEQRVAVHRDELSPEAVAEPAVAAGAVVDGRFPPDVHAVLAEFGWTPGRDVPGQVAGWVDELVREQPWLPEDRPEALAAGRRVLAEFGGLSFPLYGPGQETAMVPFRFHPGRGLPDTYAFEYLGERLGAPLFPLGTVADGRYDLVVDGLGRVFLAGDVDRYLGATIDEALVRLVRGLVAPPAG